MERPSCELVATPEEVRNYLLTYPATVAIHGDFGVFANESQGAGRALNSVVFSLYKPDYRSSRSDFQYRVAQSFLVLCDAIDGDLFDVKFGWSSTVERLPIPNTLPADRLTSYYAKSELDCLSRYRIYQKRGGCAARVVVLNELDAMIRDYRSASSTILMFNALLRLFAEAYVQNLYPLPAFLPDLPVGTENIYTSDGKSITDPGQENRVRQMIDDLYRRIRAHLEKKF